MEAQLNILIQSSDYYAPFAGVMLTSLFENNKDIERLTIYLLTSDMSERHRNRFFDLAQKYERAIKFLDAGKVDKFLDERHVSQYNGSYTTYYKIFAMSLINDEIDRLVYLDSDIVVHGSLSYLVNVDLGDKVLGMCNDSLLGGYKQMIRLDSPFYYNAGVIVFDVKKWISGKWMDKIIYHITKVHGKYPIVDQDLLNIVLCGKIKTLPMTYNINSAIFWYQDYQFFTASHGLKDYYSESEFIQAMQNPIILHCLGTFGTRPWYEGDHAVKEIWRKYLMISPWSYYTYQKVSMSFMNRVQYFLFKYAPNSFFAAIHKTCWYLALRKQIKDLGI